MKASSPTTPPRNSPIASPKLTGKSGLKLNFGLSQLRLNQGKLTPPRVCTNDKNDKPISNSSSSSNIVVPNLKPRWDPSALADIGAGLGISTSHNANRLSYQYTERGSLLLQKSGVRIGRTGLRTQHCKEPSIEGDMSSSMNNESTMSQNIIRLNDLGHGASGAVYKGIHARSLQLLAVKEVPVHDKSQRQQIGAEIRALTSQASLSKGHGIVSFHDAFTSRDGSSVSIVMEYCAGGSLQDLSATVGPLDEGVISSVAYDALRGLSSIHGLGLLHRDIKPSNMLLDSEGSVKLADFGLVREVAPSANAVNTVEAVAVHTFVGTAIYMSPERLRGDVYSYSSDIWSLGLSLLTLKLGRFPLNVPKSNLYWHLMKALCPPSVDTFSDDDNAGGNAAAAPTARKAAHTAVPHKPKPDPTELFLCPQNAENISPTLFDFIRGCLQGDPSARTDIHSLLNHPFVSHRKNLEGFKKSYREVTPIGNMARRISELRGICLRVCTFHINAVTQSGKNLHSIPLVDGAVRTLSEQLGLPEKTVNECMKEQWKLAVETRGKGGNTPLSRGRV